MQNVASKVHHDFAKNSYQSDLAKATCASFLLYISLSKSIGFRFFNVSIRDKGTIKALKVSWIMLYKSGEEPSTHFSMPATVTYCALVCVRACEWGYRYWVNIPVLLCRMLIESTSHITVVLNFPSDYVFYKLACKAVNSYNNKNKKPTQHNHVFQQLLKKFCIHCSKKKPNKQRL